MEEKPRPDSLSCWFPSKCSVWLCVDLGIWLVCHALILPLYLGSLKVRNPHFKNFKQIHKWKYLRSPISVKNRTGCTENFQQVLFVLIAWHRSVSALCPSSTALCVWFGCLVGEMNDATEQHQKSNSPIIVVYEVNDKEAYLTGREEENNLIPNNRRFIK